MERAKETLLASHTPFPHQCFPSYLHLAFAPKGCCLGASRGKVNPAELHGQGDGDWAGSRTDLCGTLWGLLALSLTWEQKS